MSWLAARRHENLKDDRLCYLRFCVEQDIQIPDWRCTTCFMHQNCVYSEILYGTWNINSYSDSFCESLFPSPSVRMGKCNQNNVVVFCMKEV